MTEQEQLRENIDVLKSSINHDWRDLASKPLTKDQRLVLRQHITSCIGDLTNLLLRLDQLALEDKDE